MVQGSRRLLRAGALLCAVLLATTAFANVTPVGSMYGSRSFTTMTLLNDGRVFVMGGSVNGAGSANPEMFNPATGTFSTLSQPNVLRSECVSVLLSDGRVFIAGGGMYVPYASSAEIFNPASGSFSFIGNTLVSRADGLSAIRLGDGRVLLVGGSGQSQTRNSAEIYDPSTGAFSMVAATMTAPRAHASLTMLADGRVLVAGGYNDSGVLTSAEIFDPATGQFTATGSMAIGRANFPAVRMNNGKVLVTGNDPTGLVEAFNPATGTFETAGHLNQPRQITQMALLPSGKVLISCGWAYGSETRDNELYDPATGNIIYTASSGAPRYYHAVVRLADGRVLVAGGWNTATAEIFEECVSNPPRPTITFTEGSSPVCPGNYITLDAGDGYASYRWSNGATTRSIRVWVDAFAPWIDYSVTGFDANGCASPTVRRFEFTASRLYSVGINTAGATTFCSGGTGGTLTADEMNMYAGPYTRQWMWRTENSIYTTIAGQTGQSYTLNAADFPGVGNYYVKEVSTAHCGEQASTVDIPVSIVTTLPAPTITAPMSVCSSGTASVPAVYGSYNWTVTNGDYYPNGGANSITFTPRGSDPMQITVDVSSGPSCSASSSVTVGVGPLAPPSIDFYPSTLCPGASGSAYVPNSSSYSSFAWTIVNGVLDTPANGSYVYYHRTSSDPVQLSVTVTDFGACSATASVTVPNGDLAPPAVDLYPQAICQNGSPAYASVMNSSNYSSFNWSVTNGSITGPNNSSYISFVANTQNPVQVTVAVTDYNGCSATQTVSMPIAHLAAPAVDTYPAALCVNGTPGYASVQNSSNYAYFSWTIANGVIDGPSNNSWLSYHATTTNPVQLTVNVTDFSGCTASQSVTVPIAQLAAPTINSYTMGLCPNGSPGYASVDHSYDYNTFSWSVTNGAIDGSSTSSYVNFHATGNNPVTLSVTVTDYSGCSASQSIEVPIRTLTAPTISYYSGGLCPNGTPGYASVDQAYNYNTFSWSVTNGAIDGANNNSYVNFHATGNNAVTLSVTVTDYSGCSASQSIEVPIRSLSAPTISYTSGGLCPNGTPGYASVDQSYNYNTFSWSVTNGVSDGPTNNNYLNFHATGTEPVTVTVTVTDFGGCSASQSIEVPIRTLSAPTITYNSGGLCPNGTPGYASVDQAYNYNTFSWSVTNGVVDGANNNSYVNFHATGTNPVTLTVTVTDFGGCSASQSIVVPIRTLSAPTISSGGAVCANAAGYASVDQPYNYNSYSWSIANGAIDGSATGSGVSFHPTGGGDIILSLTVTDFGGCAASNSITIPVKPLPDTPIISVVQQYSALDTASDGGPRFALASNSGNTYTFCGYGDLRAGLTVVNRTAGDTYLWSNGATTPSISVTQGGTYSVTVTNTQGCSSSSAVTVNFQAPPSATITAGGSTEICPAGGSVTLTANAADAYMWSTGETTQSIVVTQPGSYSVHVTTNTCTGPESQPVVVSYASATITADHPLCAGGSVTLTANAGASYHWSTGATTRSITVTTPGSYTVDVTDAAGCTVASAPYAVGAPASVSISAASASVCIREHDLLTANVTGGSGPFTYQWSMDGTPISGATSATYDYYEPSWISATSHSFTVTVTEGACSSTSPVMTIGINPSPNLYMWSQAPPLCAGTHGMMFIAFAPQGSTFAWTISGGTIVSQSTGSYGPYLSGWVEFVAGSSSAVTLTVTATGPTGCAETATTTIPVDATAAPAITAGGPTTFCAGGSVTLTASSGYTNYHWSTGETSQSITVSAAGEYKVSASGPNGCALESQPVVVAVNSNPTASITAGGPTTFCAGGSVTLTAPAGYSYLWLPGNATTRSITVSTTGNYTVTVTDANGCSATSAATAVTANANPTATITPSGATTFCAGGSVTLTAPAGYAYLWLPGNLTTQSISATASGNYTVTVTDANGCSATSAATAVTVNNNPPTPSISNSGALTFCAGGSVTLTAPAGYASYLWLPGNATTQSISATATGNYTVTVTDANGCSATSAAKVVTVNNNPPTPSISNSGALTFCAGGSVTLTAPAGYASYLWLPGNATTPSINATATGNYTVTVTDANGCSATSAAKVVTVNNNPPTPSITPSGNTTFCAGGSVTLTAPAGFSYSWSNGAITQSINVTSTGNFTVTVRDANNCTATSAVTAVTVNPSPAITSFGPTSQQVKVNKTPQTITVVASGSGLTYQWYKGASGNTATPVAGATGASYVPPTNVKGTFTYWVRVKIGTCSADSATATVVVQ